MVGGGDMIIGRTEAIDASFDGWSGLQVNSALRCRDELAIVSDLLGLLGNAAANPAFDADAHASGIAFLASILQKRVNAISGVLTEIVQGPPAEVGAIAKRR